MPRHQVRLTRASVFRYHMPLKRAYGTARGVVRTGINFVVQLSAAAGSRHIEGVGECQPRHKLTGDGGKDRVAAWAFVCDTMRHLQGRELRFAHPDEAVSAIRELMAELDNLARQRAQESDQKRPFRGTLLGIEVALLDVVSQALGLSVAELLGRKREQIGVTISTISSSTSLDEVAARVIKQARFPMTRVKGIGDVDRDVALLELVAQANRSVGREKALWIDINEALDVDGAVSLVRALVQRMAAGTLPRSVLAEGLLPKDSQTVELPRLQRLADEECRSASDNQALDLRIMPDEGLWDTDDLAVLNAHGGCRAINIKAPKAGGLIASLDLAEAAVRADPDIHICLGGMVGTSDLTAWALHNLARALPRVDYLTAVPPQNVQARITEPLARYVEKGSNLIAPQTLPGIGTRLCVDKVEPYIQASFDASVPASVVDTPPSHDERTASDAGSRVDARTLVFAGDTSLGDVYVNQTGGDLLRRLEHDPMSFLEGLRPVVAEHDALVLNLETVLADAPRSPFQGRKRYLGWDSPSRTISCLAELGVDAVSLANNHSMDFGPQHLLQMRTLLQEAGIGVFGAGDTRAEAEAPLTLRLRFGDVERRVHLIGAMEVQRKLRDEYGFYATEERPGVNPLSRTRVTSLIRSLRTSDPASLIIVFPHWGRNYQWASESMQRTAEALVTAGADLVLGHGAHMLQQCSFGDHHAIAYSLGNFLFNWAGRFQKLGAPPFGLVARTAVRPSGQRWHVDLRLYPILIDNRVTNHRPAPVDEEMFERVWTALRDVDLDGSFEKRAQAARDDVGYHIAYSYETGTGARPEEPREEHRPRVTTTATVAAPVPNAYDDADSRALIGRLGKRLLSSLLIARQAEKDGATVDWLAGDTFVASVAGRELLFKANRCLESIPAARLVGDKALVKAFLREASVSTPDGGVAESPEEALRLFASLGAEAVVKPARGDRGSGVTVGVRDERSLEAAYQRAYAPGGVIVEELVRGPEYRCLATADECIAVIQRDAPHVVGDGVHTVAELITEKNGNRRHNPSLHFRPIVMDDHLIAYIGRSGMTLDSVPPAGEKVYVGGAANLTIGGESVECTDAVPEIVKQTAVAAVRAIPGLRWAGVDLVVTDDGPGRDGRACVLEINANAGISGFHYPVYGVPRNVARRLWETRLAHPPSPAARTRRARGGITPPIHTAPRPFVAMVSDDEGSDAGRTVNLSALLERRLVATGAKVTRLGPQLIHVHHGSDRYLFHGWCSTDDLSVVSQVLGRPSRQRRLLRRHGIRQVPGRMARTVDEAIAFLAKVGTAVLVLPGSGAAGASATMVDAGNERAMREALGQNPGGAVFLRGHPSGHRFLVFANRQRAAAVLCRDGVSSATPLTTRDVDGLAKVAVAAVNAVPELRWAGVSVVLAAEGRRPLVEGLTMDVAVREGDVVVAGSLDDVFDAILPAGLRTPPGRQERMDFMRRWRLFRWPLVDRRSH